MRGTNPYLEYPERAVWDDDEDLPNRETREFYMARFQVQSTYDARVVVVPTDWPRLRAFGRVEYSRSGPDGPWNDIEGPDKVIEIKAGDRFTLLLRATPSEHTRAAKTWTWFSLCLLNLNYGANREASLLESIETGVVVNTMIEKAAYGLYADGKFRQNLGQWKDGLMLAAGNPEPDTSIMFNVGPGGRPIVARYDGPRGTWLVDVRRRSLMPKSWPYRADRPDTTTDVVS